MSEPIVRFVGIGKTYDGVARVVDHLDLDIRRGEFLTLLGPSGSGKTTTLMMLAGFETPTEGEILLEGKPLSKLPPYRRSIGMVFQNYALFPHMTVAQNIGFPLSVRGIAAAEIAQRVERALDMVQLPGLGARRPAQLSGGQQQRIAVARALVFEPKLVLMDEPLGALDKQLREQMQLEVRRLHQRLGVTMIYVTHDQHEALTMSDRIAVFHRGRVQQLDRPELIYEQPSNAFVARFIGENNRLLGRLEGIDGDRCTIRLAGDALVEGSLAAPLPPGANVMVSLRPERVQIGGAAPTIAANGHCRLSGRLREVIYLGDHVRARVALPGNDDFTVKRPIDDAHRLPAIGQPVELAWAPEHCRAFAREDAEIPT
ncbi:MAG TPA: ABC transporter ATP-binding protein [Casimicrobiaceae bacterium]|nr:ABC transporter ATP-binding protein [Casimicrobiaceae bacterium]